MTSRINQDAPVIEMLRRRYVRLPPEASNSPTRRPNLSGKSRTQRMDGPRRLSSASIKSSMYCQLKTNAPFCLRHTNMSSCSRPWKRNSEIHNASKQAANVLSNQHADLRLPAPQLNKSSSRARSVDLPFAENWIFASPRVEGARRLGPSWLATEPGSSFENWEYLSSALS